MELLDDITSYVDNEIKDYDISLRLKKLIANDSELHKEYVIQKTIKNLLSNRLREPQLNKKICDKLKYNILKKIENSISNKNEE